MKKNECLDKNGNEQNINVVNDCDKSFIHDLKSEYMKKQNIITANLKIHSAIFF